MITRVYIATGAPSREYTLNCVSLLLYPCCGAWDTNHEEERALAGNPAVRQLNYVFYNAKVELLQCLDAMKTKGRLLLYRSGPLLHGPPN